MKILILGAAGEIGTMLTDSLPTHTDANIMLYARKAKDRVRVIDNERETVIEGDFKDGNKLKEAMQGIDIVYINAMGDKAAMLSIAEAMRNAGVKRIIGATILGIYDEVTGAFGEWNKRMVGAKRTHQVEEATKVFEDPAFDYTLLRLTWLYNEEGNTKYQLTQKGEPFVGAQVTRQAVAKLITDIVTAKDNRFIQKSLGVSEPDTDWSKPSFY